MTFLVSLQFVPDLLKVPTFLISPQVTIRDYLAFVPTVLHSFAHRGDDDADADAFLANHAIFLG